MDIKANSLFAQMQAMSLEARGVNNADISKINSSEIGQVNSSGSDFGSLLKSAVENVNELQKDAGDKRTAFELGDSRVTLAETMIAAQKSSVAFEATVQVRNKFVEAYKEIMSMPV